MDENLNIKIRGPRNGEYLIIKQKLSEGVFTCVDVHANSIIKHSMLFKNKIIKLLIARKLNYNLYVLNIHAIWVFYNLVCMRIQTRDKSRSLKFYTIAYCQ